MTESICTPPSSKLFTYTLIDRKESIDQILECCFGTLNSLKKADSTGKQISQHVIIGRQQHDEIAFGYLYGMLTDSSNAAEHYRDLLLHNLDQLDAVGHVCNELITNFLHKLQDISKHQICWLIDQGIKTGVKKISTLMFQLLREVQMCPVAIIEYLVGILEANLNWVTSTSLMSAMIVYTLIPLIKNYDSHPNLQNRQTILCIKLIKLKWSECARIGRDFLRSLQSVCAIPEFYSLWQDILKNQIAEQIEGQIETILFQRTQRKFLLSRLTYDVERKLMFLLNEVSPGEELQYYEEWISHDLSSTNRIDMIRYLCSAACESQLDHQRREEMRKHILYWLVSSSETSNELDKVHTRIAFVFDWLVYKPGRRQTIDPQVTKCFNWVIQYLTDFSKIFFFPLEEKLSACVANFIQNVWSVNQSLVENEERIHKPDKIPDIMDENNADFSSSDDGDSIPDMDDAQNEFVEEHDTNMKRTRLCIGPCTPFYKQDIIAALSNIPSSHKVPIQKLLKEKYKQKRQKLIHSLIQNLQELEKFSVEELNNLALLLLHILRFSVPKPLMPKKKLFAHHVLQPPTGDSKLEIYLSTKLLSRPLFMFFNYVCGDDALVPLLKNMYLLQPRIGYLFLLFIRLTSHGSTENIEVYRKFASNSEPTMDKDLNICYKDEANMFLFLLPFTCRACNLLGSKFPTLNNDLIRLVVDSVTEEQLSQLACRLSLGDIMIFAEKRISKLIKSSLQWTYAEQSNLWILLRAQLPMKVIIKYFSHLEANSIALVSLMQMLSISAPSTDWINIVFARQPPDIFSMTILIEWCNCDLSGFVEGFVRIVQKLYTPIKTRGRKQSKRKHTEAETDSSSDTESLEDEMKINLVKVLRHVDCLRLSSNSNCLRFLLSDAVCSCLCQAGERLNPNDRKTFEELLQLAKDFCEENSKSRMGRPRRTSVGKDTINIPSSEESDESTKDQIESKHVKVSNEKHKLNNADPYGWKPSIRLSSANSTSLTSSNLDRTKHFSTRNS